HLVEVQIFLGLGITVGAACNDDEAVCCGLTCGNRAGFAFGLAIRTGSDFLFKGVTASKAIEHALLGGGIDDTGNGMAIFDEGDVHREFAILVDELLRAVERIDQKEGTANLGYMACGS